MSKVNIIVDKQGARFLSCEKSLEMQARAKKYKANTVCVDYGFKGDYTCEMYCNVHGDGTVEVITSKVTNSAGEVL